MFDPEDLDHADLPGAPAVRPCAGLDIPGHFYHPYVLTLRYPALVQGEPVQLLGLGTVLDRDLNWLVGHHHPVCRNLDLVQLVGCNMLEVADIDAGALGPFLRPGLVDVDA